MKCTGYAEVCTKKYIRVIVPKVIFCAYKTVSNGVRLYLRAVICFCLKLIQEECITLLVQTDNVRSHCSWWMLSVDVVVGQWLCDVHLEWIIHPLLKARHVMYFSIIWGNILTCCVTHIETSFISPLLLCFDVLQWFCFFPVGISCRQRSALSIFKWTKNAHRCNGNCSIKCSQILGMDYSEACMWSVVT